MNVLLRRRKLGFTSCKEIRNKSQHIGKVVRNDRVEKGIDRINPDDVVIRWGCTANVPANKVINKAQAIHEVNNKLGFRKTLQEAGLCPDTSFSLKDFKLNKVVDGGFFPVVVRKARHAQGRNLHVCRELHELERVCRRYGEGNYYISRLIDKEAEYRVFVVQGRVACVAKKTPANPEEVAWNVAKGGRFDNVRWGDWPLKAVKTSVEAFNLSSLDFGGVDVMVDRDGKCYILEINSAPSLTSPYRQDCMAQALDWMLDNGKDRLEVKEERGGWRKFVHPGVSDEAELV